MILCGLFLVVSVRLLQKKRLFDDLNELAEEIEGVLMNHLSMFNIKAESDVEKIEERVKWVALPLCRL